MLRYIRILIFLAILSFSLSATKQDARANERAPIDTVFSFTKGAGQSVGQDSAYFPANIFKVPPSSAGPESPASSPTDVCSLGFGGEIVVGFKNYEIIDGDGADFTIFENVLHIAAIDRWFIEPAVVSVSEDGETYYEFPHDSITYAGCAGVEPTNGSSDIYNPDSSGGDVFDLATLGLKSIRYIKIKDISSELLNNPKSKFYDALISGFDLDCALGLHLRKIISNDSSLVDFTETAKYLEIRLNGSAELSVYNLLGVRMENISINDAYSLDKSKFPIGANFITITKNGKVYRKAFLSA